MQLLHIHYATLYNQANYILRASCNSNMSEYSEFLASQKFSAISSLLTDHCMFFKQLPHAPPLPLLHHGNRQTLPVQIVQHPIGRLRRGNTHDRRPTSLRQLLPQNGIWTLLQTRNDTLQKISIPLKIIAEPPNKGGTIKIFKYNNYG